MGAKGRDNTAEYLEKDVSEEKKTKIKKKTHAEGRQ